MSKIVRHFVDIAQELLCVGNHAEDAAEQLRVSEVLIDQLEGLSKLIEHNETNAEFKAILALLSQLDERVFIAKYSDSSEFGPPRATPDETRCSLLEIERLSTDFCAAVYRCFCDENGEIFRNVAESEHKSLNPQDSSEIEKIRKDAETEQRFSHTDAFDSIHVDGETIALNSRQAAVIKVLWERAESGHPIVSLSVIADKCDVENWGAIFRACKAKEFILKPTNPETNKPMKSSVMLSFGASLKKNRMKS